MAQTTTFQLRMEGLKPEKLVEIQGEKGPFYTCTSGSTPELRKGFFYGDDRYQFCFFTKLIADPPVGDRPALYDLEIYYATCRRIDGVLPKMPRADVEYIERNITHLFRTHDFTIPTRPVRPDDSPREIRFTWSISL